MKIFYIHGWRSLYDPAKSKIILLNKMGKVTGRTFDYTQPVAEIFGVMHQAVIEDTSELIVGTSFGGFWAAKVAKFIGLPFVSINPLLRPHAVLTSKIGKGTTYDGIPFELTRKVVDQYRNEKFPEIGNGLILLDTGDKVLSSETTRKALQDKYLVHSFPNGSHRFDHMNEALETIESFYNTGINKRFENVKPE